jgi:hypothetical protein
MIPRRCQPLRPVLDQLEAREVPAGVVTAPTPAPVAVVATAPPAATSTTAAERPDAPVGTRVAAFAAAHVGRRVAGGECAQLAAEALRVAGARFTVFGEGIRDYAWGTPVATVTGTAHGGTYSESAAAVRVGDVLQYANVRFRDGTAADWNTAIVAAVDAAGRVTAVYQQNFNGVRAVARHPLDLSTLVAGTVKVYRPIPRLAAPGRFRFSIVNSTGASVAVTEQAGSGSAAYTLTRADTAASYQARWWVTYGGARLILTAAGRSVAVEDGAGYEVYRTAAGAVAIRKLVP